MIRMSDGYNNPDYNNEIIYSINLVTVVYSGHKIKLAAQSSKDVSLKLFEFEKQAYIDFSETPKFDIAFKQLGISQEKCIGAYRLLKASFASLGKLKKQGTEFCFYFFKTQSILGNNTIKDLTAYKGTLGVIKNSKFLSFLGKFGETQFTASMGISLKSSLTANAGSSLGLSSINKVSNNIKFGIAGLGVSLPASAGVSLSGRTSIRGGALGFSNGLSGQVGTAYGTAGIQSGSDVQSSSSSVNFFICILF